MAQVRVFDPGHPEQRSNPIQRKIGTNQQSAGTGTAGSSSAQAAEREDKLRKENERLKAKIESFQDKLDEIADVASASPDGSEDDDVDELAEKLNTILDLAAPGSEDDTDA
jgi:hypothetical protein